MGRLARMQTLSYTPGESLFKVQVKVVRVQNTSVHFLRGYISVTSKIDKSNNVKPDGPEFLQPCLHFGSTYPL